MSYQLLVFDYRSLIKNITHAAVVKIRKNWNVYHRCLCYIFNHVDTSCPFGGLLTSMSTEFSILNISALGLLAQFLSFCTDFTIHHLSSDSLLYTSQVFNYGSKSFRLLLPIVSNVCQFLSTKKTRWPTPMGTWKLNNPPLTRGQEPITARAW